MAMYKYNSWIRPSLPAEWNQVTHPYAVMLRMNESDAIDSARLLVSSLPFVVKLVDGTQVIAFTCEASIYESFWFTGNEQWWDLAEHEMEHGDEEYHYIPVQTTDDGMGYHWAWCNESIRDDSNNVVYPGSVPILIEEPEEPEAYDKQRFLNGLAAALCSKARAFSKPEREPIGFLYGHVAKEGETPTHTINGEDYVGVVMTALPERDEEKYPLLVVHNVGRWGTWATAGKEASYITNSIDGKYMLRFAGGYLSANQRRDENLELINEWNNFSESADGSYFNEYLPQIFWANFDVLDENGEVYLKASKPIPIYE